MLSLPVAGPPSLDQSDSSSRKFVFEVSSQTNLMKTILLNAVNVEPAALAVQTEKVISSPCLQEMNRAQ